MTFAHEEEIFPTLEAPDPSMPEESNVSNEKAETESEKKRKSPEKPTEKKVRRYVYNDVVRLDDLEKLIDCSYVQPYTINSAKVIFLKPRPQSRPFKGSGNICLTCDRILQEPFHFCSLSCKVDHVMGQGEDLSSILFRFDESDFTFSHFENLRMDSSDLIEDDGQMTPNSILEHPYHYNGSSGSRRAKE